MKAQFITAEEVQQVLGISRSKAYQIVQALNRELKAAGYITIAGKFPSNTLNKNFMVCKSTEGMDHERRKRNDRLCHIC